MRNETAFVETRVVFRDSRIIQTLKNKVAGESYVISHDETVDFNQDGIQDLGVSNGAGRDGDGFNYWWYDRRAGRYKSLGEFSRLQRDSNNPTQWFYVVSTGDTYYARRYNYVFRSGGLVLDSVYGFKQCTEELNCAELAVLKAGKVIAEKKFRSEKERDECMLGTSACL